MFELSLGTPYVLFNLLIPLMSHSDRPGSQFSW